MLNCTWHDLYLEVRSEACWKDAHSTLLPLGWCIRRKKKALSQGCGGLGERGTLPPGEALQLYEDTQSCKDLQLLISEDERLNDPHELQPQHKPRAAAFIQLCFTAVHQLWQPIVKLGTRCAIWAHSWANSELHDSFLSWIPVLPCVICHEEYFQTFPAFFVTPREGII